MRTVRRLRQLTLIEGVSTLILFFVAMPLKYLAGMPEAVKVAGFLLWMILKFVFVKKNVGRVARSLSKIPQSRLK